MASVPIGKLSRGYRQRVDIGQALLNDPKLLIFDEPTSGLDPSQVITIRDLIRELAGRQTVLIASHVLPEIEQIASRVMILLEGKLLTADALARSRRSAPAAAGRGSGAGGARLHRRRSGRALDCRRFRASAPVLRYLVEADQRPAWRSIWSALVGHGLAPSDLQPCRPISSASSCS